MSKINYYTMHAADKSLTRKSVLYVHCSGIISIGSCSFMTSSYCIKPLSL